MTRVVGVSLGHRDVAEADRWIRSLRPAPAQAYTHLVRDPYPHVAISLVWGAAEAPPTTGALSRAADAAAAAHGRSGRAVVFDGVERLVGVLTVADVYAASAIEEIRVLGGGAVGPDDDIVTRDFVRPQLVDGVLTLSVTPVAGGRYAPFEVADPTPCCAAH